MKHIKKNWPTIIKILITYLAISKIMSWYETFTSMNELDLSSFWNRLLGRDILIIIGATLFYYFEKLIFRKKNQKETLLQHIVYYVMGYFAMIAVFLFLMFFVWQENYNQSLWLGTLIDGTLGYIVIMIVLNIKDYFKSKEEKKANFEATVNSEANLAMLQALLNNGILTQEEFHIKCQKIEEEN